jgi:hypothetical protein
MSKFVLAAPTDCNRRSNRRKHSGMAILSGCNSAQPKQLPLPTGARAHQNYDASADGSFIFSIF